MPKWLFLGEAMKDQLAQSMAEAGREEREEAIANNHFHQGVPYISACGCRWWVHGRNTVTNSYNAKSGVAVIFGLHTKKLLFLGVRNKLCVKWLSANRSTTSPLYHNWSGSSCAMESDIVAQGFWLSETIHRICHLKLVDDGDSSVMATIGPSIPNCSYIKKVECANLAVKSYCSRLEELAKDNPCTVLKQRWLDQTCHTEADCWRLHFSICNSYATICVMVLLMSFAITVIAIPRSASTTKSSRSTCHQMRKSPVMLSNLKSLIRH